MLRDGCLLVLYLSQEFVTSLPGYGKGLEGTCLRTLRVHGEGVSALAALPEDKLASGSYDHTVCIWDTTSGACLLTLAGHTSSVYGI